jgi:GTPase involved in cell partitioning and DNA repair
MFIITGNKIDLEADRRVNESTATDFARRIECRHVEISAHTGEGMNPFGRAMVDYERQYIGTSNYRSRVC